MDAKPSEADTLAAHREKSGLLRLVLNVQAVYYIVSGIWPIVHMDSFIAVTGPKQDLWLVITVGAQIVAVGVALVVGAARRVPTVATATLAIGVALALTAVDVVYVFAGRISAIYLADAAAEIALILGVITGWVWMTGGSPAAEHRPATTGHVVSETRR